MNSLESSLSRQFATCLRRFDPDMDEAVAWAARLASQAVIEGHVCIDLRRYAGWQVEAGVRLPELSLWTEALQGSAVVGRPREFKPLILDGCRLYLARYWRYEKNLADDLLARAEWVDDDLDQEKLRADLDRLFAHNAEQPDWQKVAAATAVLRRLCVVSGGPGTGKTATVVRILAALQSQAEGRLRIALAAPTGKAAARMQESIRAQKASLALPQAILEAIPETASTLHRLLGSRPDSVYFRHHRGNPLAVDAVAVDEASMVDLALMAKLVDALPPRARLILLGDRDQLSAVEAGAVFGDLCAGRGHSAPFLGRMRRTAGVDVGEGSEGTSHLADSIVLLKHSHRFGGASGIGELAQRVNRGEAEAAMALLQSGRFSDIVWHAKSADLAADELLKRLEAGYRAFFSAVEGGAGEDEVLMAFNRFRILAAHREGPASAASVNRLFEAYQRERLQIGAHARWYPGRAVIVTRNDYGLRLFNGDVGVCLRKKGELRVFFEDADGRIRSLAPGRVPEHETVYAMTVHKSQGSEFDEVVLILPDAVSPVLNRPLIYTAITRAKKGVEIWGSEESLATAVRQVPERTGGLRERLWG